MGRERQTKSKLLHSIEKRSRYNLNSGTGDIVNFQLDVSGLSISNQEFGSSYLGLADQTPCPHVQKLGSAENSNNKMRDFPAIS